MALCCQTASPRSKPSQRRGAFLFSRRCASAVLKDATSPRGSPCQEFHTNGEVNAQLLRLCSLQCCTPQRRVQGSTGRLDLELPHRPCLIVIRRITIYLLLRDSGNDRRVKVPLFYKGGKRSAIVAEKPERRPKRRHIRICGWPTRAKLGHDGYKGQSKLSTFLRFPTMIQQHQRLLFQMPWGLQI